MIPTLAPGDRLLVLRTRRCRVGDICAARDPAESARLLVKRVVSVSADRIELAGDNEGASRDSRSFGPVGRRDLVGRAVFTYHPPHRAGRLRRGPV